MSESYIRLLKMINKGQYPDGTFFLMFVAEKNHFAISISFCQYFFKNINF